MCGEIPPGSLGEATCEEFLERTKDAEEFVLQFRRRDDYRIRSSAMRSKYNRSACLGIVKPKRNNALGFEGTPI